MTNSRLVQLKAFADDKRSVTQKTEILLEMSGKVGGKRRKYWSPAFSPFPTVFSKAPFFRVIKSRKCVSES